MSLYDETTAAIAAKRAGSDNWRLGDALISAVPAGHSRSGFDAVRTAAEQAGVKPLSVSALRQYRDVAISWPESARVPGVSFSAHRAAIRTAEPGRLLADLAARHGAENVTVKIVEQAIDALAGRPSRGSTPSTTSTTTSATPTSAPTGHTCAPGLGEISVSDLLSEIVKRGTEQEIAAAPDYVNLTKVIAKIDRAKSAKAAKAAAWSGTGSKTNGAKTNGAKPTGTAATPKARAGSVRGL